MGRLAPLAAVAAVAAILAAVAAAPASTSPPREKRVYILGDSYTVQMNRQGLHAAFGPDWQVHSAARGGRNVKVTPPTPSGMQQLYEDRAIVAAAGHVVIALGTNSGDSSRFVENLKLLIREIRALNPAARIYWVEVGHFVGCWQQPPDCFDTNQHQRQPSQRNAAVNALAPQLDIKIVPWAGAAYAHPEWFAADPSHKHPDVEGTSRLMHLIVTAVHGASPPGPDPSPEPTASPSPTPTPDTCG